MLSEASSAVAKSGGVRGNGVGAGGAGLASGTVSDEPAKLDARRTDALRCEIIVWVEVESGQGPSHCFVLQRDALHDNVPESPQSNG